MKLPSGVRRTVHIDTLAVRDGLPDVVIVGENGVETNYHQVRINGPCFVRYDKKVRAKGRPRVWIETDAEIEIVPWTRNVAQ